MHIQFNTLLKIKPVISNILSCDLSLVCLGLLVMFQMSLC